MTSLLQLHRGGPAAGPARRQPGLAVPADRHRAAAHAGLPQHRPPGAQGAQWRYESFTGQIGRSDIAGTLQVDTAGRAPDAQRRAGLAPARPGRPRARRRRPRGDRGAGRSRHRRTPPARVLPDLPFDTARWASLDADVTLNAQSLLHAESLPLEDLQLRLRADRPAADARPADLRPGRRRSSSCGWCWMAGPSRCAGRPRAGCGA